MREKRNATLMERWKAVTGALAESFLKGDVSVDPRDYGRQDSACRYCDQRALCRVFDE